MSGGAVSVERSASFTMSGGKIDGNTGKGGGGGAYVVGGSFTMKGSSLISLSTGAEENEQGKNDVYLKDGAKITVPAALTGTVPAARITPAAYAPTTKVLDGSKVGTEHRKFRVTPEPATPPKIWSVGSDGKLKTP